MTYKINPHKKITYYTWRFRFMLIILMLIFITLLGRMVNLMILNQAFLRKKSDARVLRTVEDSAYRGMILDRNGNPLAISIPVKAVWIDPQNFFPTAQQLQQLASLLRTTVKAIRQQVTKNNYREFLYLQRGIAPEVAEQIKKLKIANLFLRQEYRRYYPQADVTAHLLGFTNIDDRGQEGLELAYNETLQGENGLRRVIKDRLGHIIAEIGILRKPRAGQDIQLSIDQRIQYSAYKHLKETVTKFNATAGSVVVLDVQSGEVLAMTNFPAYNPNRRPSLHNEHYRNRAVTDIFEPGSTAKPFTVYLGLASGKYKPNTLISTAPGWVMINNNRVQDTSNHGAITVTEVLRYSSNIGVSRIVLSLPPNALWELLNKLGFGTPTNSNFPGESSGKLTVRRYWNPFVLATLSFGYNMSTTVLQLARAYTTIAAYGMEKPVSLMKMEHAVAGQQVMDPKITRTLINMMKIVTAEACVPGYLVAGKTGTSRMVGPSGYMKNHHNAVFAGMAPASCPRLVVIAYITDPKKLGYYAGTVASPLFAKIMADALQILNVPRDATN